MFERNLSRAGLIACVIISALGPAAGEASESTFGARSFQAFAIAVAEASPNQNIRERVAILVPTGFFSRPLFAAIGPWLARPPGPSLGAMDALKFDHLALSVCEQQGDPVVAELVRKVEETGYFYVLFEQLVPYLANAHATVAPPPKPLPVTQPQPPSHQPPGSSSKDSRFFKGYGPAHWVSGVGYVSDVRWVKGVGYVGGQVVKQR